MTKIPLLLSILALELILCDFYIFGAIVALTALEIWEYGNKKGVDV